MRRSPLALLFLMVFVDLLGFGMVVPLLPLYAERLGASGLWVGLLLACYSFAQFLFAPVWGALSDRIGRRPVLRISIALQGAGFLVFGLAHSLPLLFAARFLAGLGGANISTAQAYIADVTTPNNRARGMGLIGAAFGLGFVLGPAFGGILARHFSPAAPALAAAGLSLLNLIGTSTFLPESLKVKGARAVEGRLRQLLSAFQVPRLAVLLSVFFLNTLAFAAMEATFALLSERRFGLKEEANGYLFALAGVVMSAMQGGVVGRLAGRFSEERLSATGLVLMAAALFALPLSPNVPALALFLCLLAAGSALTSPTLASLVSKAVPNRLGSTLGINQSLGSLARVLGPAFGGLAFDRWGPSSPYLAAAALMGLTALLALVGLRVEPSAPAAPLAQES